jgi:hypothetical protein
MSNLMSTAASIKLLEKTLILLPQHIFCAMNSTVIRPQAQPNFINRNHNILVCKLPLISSQLLVQSASHAHNIDLILNSKRGDGCHHCSVSDPVKNISCIQD